MRHKHPMEKDLVVLLHGILRSDWDMYPIELTLKKRGYDCINIKYPSTKHTIEELADIVQKELETDPKYSSAKQVHFVTHSMGGVVARYLIEKHRPESLGRVTMMGPPNQGSEVADFLMEKHSFLKRAFKRIFGPAGHQLGTGLERIDGNKVNYPVGIIASDLSLNPLGKTMFGAANDTLVSVEGTKIEGMADHIVIPSTHSIMMLDPRVIEQVICFLKDGKFNHKNITPKVSEQHHSGPE